ncbi:MAG: histidine phosphatase family protein [Chloroflexota bacterium]
MLTLYLVRHGKVHNPDGIIYGHLPGFGLSDEGRAQIDHAAKVLAEQGPFQALYASPLQRAQESAAILANRLEMAVETEEAIIETGIGSYQGKPFSALPSPYITETPTHDGIESASEIRARMTRWAETMLTKHTGRQIVAVSHRDPIIVSLLFWMGGDLNELPDFDLDTGSVHTIELDESGGKVTKIV